MTFDNLQKRNRWIKGGTLKALSLSALFLFSFLFLINLTSAWNFASSDDYSLINWTRYTTYQTVTNYTETDPVWTADKSSYTLLSVLNNGSYLNPEGTDTFIGNYSTFLTHITYGDVMNGTLKDYFDGLYIGIGTETEDKWNANYSTFLSNNESITNTFGLYTTLDILNNGSYLNPDAVDTFIANYSTFLTHITYDDVMNGTLKTYFDGLYIGIGTETEDKWNANYSTFLLNNISITNALNTKLGISQWNATNTSYALLTELNNGSYLNVDTGIGNWSADKSSYTLLSVLNNGSYLNPEATDTFIANYSTFLTHITYDDVMNGTLKTYFDGFYPLITTLIDRLGNWSADKSDYYTSSQVDDVNTSMQNYVNTQNTSVTNALNTKLGISQWNATNTSYYLASNPSGFYSSISNLGNWTADKVNYYTKTEVNSINTSMKNYANFLNTTQTNHINTKLSLSGGTMTGNISLSNSGVRLTNGTQNTAVIYHNGTGWIIRG